MLVENNYQGCIYSQTSMENQISFPIFKIHIVHYLCMQRVHPKSDPQYNINHMVATGGRLSDVITLVGSQVDRVAMLDGVVYPNKSGNTSLTIDRHDDSQQTCL